MHSSRFFRVKPIARLIFKARNFPEAIQFLTNPMMLSTLWNIQYSFALTLLRKIQYTVSCYYCRAHETFQKFLLLWTKASCGSMIKFYFICLHT